MAGIHCSQCNSLINADTSSSSAPPWCPTCGADFQAAGPLDAPAAVAVAPSAGSAPVPVAAVAPPAPRRLAQAPARQPRAKVPLPPGVPAEVAALGKPEQVHAPDPKQARHNRARLRGTIACLGLLGLALGGFLWWASDNPAPHLPSPDVALGLAIGFGALGLLTTVAAFSPRGGPATFLVYENVLVELSGGRHRIIPWEKVGSLRQNSYLVLTYHFPVQGERDVRFDSAVRDHAALAVAIQDRAAERRSLIAFGGAEALAEMSAAQPGHSFLAEGVAGAKGVFRITVLGDRLLYYPLVNGAGRASPQDASAGTLQGWAQAELHRKYREEIEILEEADAATLLWLAAENDGSFAVAAADVRELHIDPPPRPHLLQGLADPTHEGFLKLVHARRGTVTVALLDREHVLQATKELPRLFGDAVKVNVVWSHSACHFVGKA
jgi:hypothetical protein